VKPGDLVKYNFSDGRRNNENPYNIERGEIGMVLESSAGEKAQSIANVYFFGAGHIKKSYEKYLEMVSESVN
jgi:hypothetical protein|tara:strand:- start:392 stop:607 length:216 start_codon:yes stop_codon:yes gene_type:complete